MISKKIYCYIDETGQDTQGKLFIVSVIITSVPQDETAKLLIEIERSSGKGKLKWGRSEMKQKLNYIKKVLDETDLKWRVCYSCYRNTKDYKNSTVLTIAKSINTLSDYAEKVFNVYVDGLNKKDEKYFGSQIHRLGIHTKKIKGVKKDENNPMIRLADSLCGFIRDVLEEENKDLKTIFNSLLKKKILYEV